MDFDTAVEILVGPSAIRSIASAAGVHPDTVSRARMPNSPNRRSPPKDWRRIVRTLALERADALTALAAQLGDA